MYDCPNFLSTFQNFDKSDIIMESASYQARFVHFEKSKFMKKTRKISQRAAKL